MNKNKKKIILFLIIISICLISLLIIDYLLPFFDFFVTYLVEYYPLTVGLLSILILYKAYAKKYDLIFFTSIGLLTGFLMSFLYL